MIQVSKEEAKVVRRYFPEVAMKRTVNKYYIEERPKVIDFLKNRATAKDVKAYC